MAIVDMSKFMTKKQLEEYHALAKEKSELLLKLKGRDIDSLRTLQDRKKEIDLRIEDIKHRTFYNYAKKTKGDKDRILEDVKSILNYVSLEDPEQYRDFYLANKIFYLREEVISTYDEIKTGNKLSLANYLFALCEAQIFTYTVYEYDINDIISLIEEKTNSYYPSEERQLSILDIYSLPESFKSLIGEVLIPEDTYTFFKTPSSTILNTFQMILTNSNLEDVASQVNRRSHSKSMTAGQNLKNAKQWQLIQKLDDGEIKIGISNIDKIAKRNSGTRKIFTYVLTQINKQAFDGKKGSKHLYRTYVTFPIQDLVDLGCYNDISNAKRGFESALNTITGNFSVAYEGKGKEDNKGKQVLFTGWHITGGQAIVEINPNFIWGKAFEFYSILPKESFKLPSHAFDLIVYIFFLARQKQNVDKIKEQGFFDINMRTVQERLGLPNEKTTKNPGQKIFDVIDKAITDIEDELKTKNLTITPYYNEYGKASEKLDQGFLRIGLTGEYSKYYIDLAESRQKQIKSRQAKKERVIEQAKIKALADKMAEEEQEKD